MNTLDNLVQDFKAGYEFSVCNLQRSIETGRYNQHIVENRAQALNIIYESVPGAVGALAALLLHPKMVYRHLKYCQPHENPSCDIRKK